MSTEERYRTYRLGLKTKNVREVIANIELHKFANRTAPLARWIIRTTVELTDQSS